MSMSAPNMCFHLWQYRIRDATESRCIAASTCCHYGGHDGNAVNQSVCRWWLHWRHRRHFTYTIKKSSSLTDVALKGHYRRMFINFGHNFMIHYNYRVGHEYRVHCRPLYLWPTYCIKIATLIHNIDRLIDAIRHRQTQLYRREQ